MSEQKKFQYAIYEKDDQIARITLNRPEKRNALNMYGTTEGVAADMLRALTEAEEDDDIKVVILKGAGPCFCSGLDLSQAGLAYGFGTKGANQAPARDDFTIATSNKQLNFVQHVMSILEPGGRAAIVVPDNVLFADQAGEVFKILTEDCDLHTVLRLPNGTFTPYSPGTKTNVIFFTKGYSTENVWVYDARTNVPRITKKDRPLTPQYFAEFETCYGRSPNGRGKRDPKKSKEDRWRSFHISEVKERDFKIDSLKWLKDESLDNSEELPEPEELAADAIAELEGAVVELNSIILMLENSNNEEGPALKSERA